MSHYLEPQEVKGPPRECAEKEEKKAKDRWSETLREKCRGAEKMQKNQGEQRAYCLSPKDTLSISSPIQYSLLNT